MSRRILRALFVVAGGASVGLLASAPAWGQQQEQTWESRLAALEARVGELEEQLKAAPGSAGNAAGGADLVLDEAPVTMTLLKKEFHEGDLLSGAGVILDNPLGLPTARYPVLDLALSTHWSTGDPLILYLQLGDAFSSEGQLFYLEYQP